MEKKKLINQLDVEIKHALITSVRCELTSDNNGNPKAKWNISGHYMTGNGLKVADFAYHTDSWNKDSEIELGDHDVFINAKMSEIFERFTDVLYRKVTGQFGKLEGGI